MLPVPGSRVVTVSSLAHRVRARINFDDLQGERSYSRVAAYGQSKLANLMFTYELQRRLSGAGTTIAVAAHPGLASTELARYTPAIVAFSYARVSQKAAMGALPTLRAATDPGVARRPVLRPGRILRGQGLPGTGPLQRAIPRHGPPAPPVDSLRRTDRGHVPGLTRPRPKAQHPPSPTRKDAEATRITRVLSDLGGRGQVTL